MSLYCQLQQQVICLMAFPHIIKAESSREQTFPRVGWTPLSLTPDLTEGVSNWTKKKEKHNPTILLGFTVAHACYHFESDCNLIRNILDSY